MAKNVKINVNAKTKVRAIKLTEDANVWENGREFTAIKVSKHIIINTIHNSFVCSFIFCKLDHFQFLNLI